MLNSTYSVLSLRGPWPESLGRISLSAARAVRAAGFNASSVTFTAPSAEVDALLRLPDGRVIVEAEDASSFYIERAADDLRGVGRRLQRTGRVGPGKPVEEPLHGSMGGFYTLDEAYAEMQRLVAMYPEWIGAGEQVGKTRQNRPIQVWCVTAGGKGCSSGGTTMPAVLYTALVHAREPATLMCLVQALRSLLKDAQARVAGAHHLLATRKLIFMPIANPDGYAWNQRRRPNGGGMKRKNGARACNPPDTENDGVDLNRNFGYKYAYDNIGSSASGCSEEYRGGGAFSEPETQAIRAVVRQHKAKAVLHWHGWGNDVAFPYSYDWRAPMSNVDLGMYQEFATEMAATNHYASGRAWESVGYTTNGEADDWGWGDEHAVSLTIEVGNSRDGFWPNPARILPIAQESVWPAKYLAWAAGPMLQLDSVKTTPSGAEPAADVTLTFQNNGLAPFTVDHHICVDASPPATRLLPSKGWAAESADGSGPSSLLDSLIVARMCLVTPALGARAYIALPPLKVQWDKAIASKWIGLTVTSSPPQMSGDEAADAAAAAAEVSIGTRRHLNAALSSGSGGGGGGIGVFASPRRKLGVDGASPVPGRSIDAFRLRILNQPQTLQGCDELCVCTSADKALVDISHECRSAIAPGSHCKVSKPSKAGTNWGSGVTDEYFVYVASQYSRGGRCTISSTKRDTLIAAYATCSRFGAQEPLGFANSEGGRTATISFPCTAGTSYYLFWNAEYMPGRFAFSITEACSGGDCVKAHRMRHLLRSRHKQRSRH